jgi:hypothetical protein
MGSWVIYGLGAEVIPCLPKGVPAPEGALKGQPMYGQGFAGRLSANNNPPGRVNPNLDLPKGVSPQQRRQ